MILMLSSYICYYYYYYYTFIIIVVLIFCILNSLMHFLVSVHMKACYGHSLNVTKFALSMDTIYYVSSTL